MTQAPAPGLGTDLRGTGRLIVDGVVGVSGIVESMHRNIAGLAPIVGSSREGATRGIAGLVYRSVRGVSRAIGLGLDTAFAQLAPLLAERSVSPRREAVVAALNGVLGDHLAATGNPLAIPMQLRQGGQPIRIESQALREGIEDPKAKLAILVHGLCMNDLQWQRDAHDHGAMLAATSGYTSLYLHYNSGRHISTNGRELATVLERLLSAWPVPVSELAVIGHSMGGLVARSALHYAKLAAHAWPRRLRALVFLGTPHHGAPLERAGHRVDAILGWSPYTAPFARLGKIRSAGVQDLRYGNIVDEDWQDAFAWRAGDPRTHVALPRGKRCFAIAASRQSRAGSTQACPRGDGLVPVRSALGRHADAARDLAVPAARQRIFFGLDHFDLLGNREVAAQIRRWLAGD